MKGHRALYHIGAFWAQLNDVFTKMFKLLQEVVG